MADHDTYDRPLKRLAHVLASEVLKPITDKLRDGADFETFLQDSIDRQDVERVAGLKWPGDQGKELALTLILIERGANDPRWFLNVAHQFYHGGSKYVESIRKITNSVIIPFGRDITRYIEQERKSATLPQTRPTDLERVFVVHGHDDAPREMVARFISKLGLEPVILHEQPNLGMTVIEKLNANGNVGYAVVLLTPDDIGRGKSESSEHPRARQNVILELGYFLGRLGRDRVVALLKDSIEIPSDYMGVVYVDFDSAGAWRQKLGRELQSVGYEIDWETGMI